MSRASLEVSSHGWDTHPHRMKIVYSGHRSGAQVTSALLGTESPWLGAPNAIRSAGDVPHASRAVRHRRLGSHKRKVLLLPFALDSLTSLGLGLASSLPAPSGLRDRQDLAN